ncbi:MAG TPA: Ig-like domain-containing protein [Gammaproteobacteria bacterium]|nr:Ig-like domain-containing protein [Gammaproteobacteria bacterium]
MRQRYVFAGLGAAAAILLIAAGCGGGGLGGYGSSSGSGGSGTISTIAITPDTSTVAINGTQQYMAVAKDSSNNTITGVTYTWKSSDTSIATVSSTGLATGVAAGTATITASVTYGDTGQGCTGPYCGNSGTPFTITSNAATLTVSASAMVMGTAAVGHPFVAALVSLKDAQGRTQYATTDAHGRFALSVSGLTAPYLLRVSDDQGHVMYSVSHEASVTNIDPFSDVMARAWYRSHGSTAEAAFINPQTSQLADAASFKVLDDALVHALSDSLQARGLDPERLSLLHTPFNADGQGLDAVLDHTRFQQQGPLFLIHTADGRAVTLEAATGHLVLRRDTGAPTPETLLNLTF